MVETLRFREKVVIVTGGGSGIGRATALAFAREGAHVAVADVSEKDGLETADTISRNAGISTFFLTDVSQSVSVNNLVASTINTFGRLDVYFSNAGIFDYFTPCMTASDEFWDRLIRTDLSSCFYSARAAFPHLSKTKGSIVMTGSVTSFRSSGAGVAYTAAKHGLVGLVKQLACEFASEGVRVNGVAPGPIHTSIVRNVESDATVIAHVPLGRFGKPEEIAEPVLFLASSASSFITGAMLPVDGGWLLK